MGREPDKASDLPRGDGRDGRPQDVQVRRGDGERRRCSGELDVAHEVCSLASNCMSSLTWMLSSERTADLMSRCRPPSARGPTRLSNFAPTSSHVNGWLENPG